MTELPAGIERGVARLTEIGIRDIYQGENAGELLFEATGVVVSPVEYAGLTTTIREPLCDTPNRPSRKTFNNHWCWVLNELYKLGVAHGALTTFQELEMVLKALSQTQPYFKFRTWEGPPSEKYPEPKVNHIWNGLCDPPVNL